MVGGGGPMAFSLFPSIGPFALHEQNSMLHPLRTRSRHTVRTTRGAHHEDAREVLLTECNSPPRMRRASPSGRPILPATFRGPCSHLSETATTRLTGRRTGTLGSAGTGSVGRPEAVT